MLGRLYENQECSAARTLELVGERWSLLILRDAMFRHFTGFSQVQKSLGVATNIIPKRLDGFVAAEIMERRRPAASGPVEFLSATDGQGVDLKLRRVRDQTEVAIRRRRRPAALNSPVRWR